MIINKYPDGSSYAELNNNSEHKFTYRLNTYEDVIHLAQILEVFNSQKRRPIVTIPNLIDAQADRRFNYNQSSGLKVITNILNNYHASYRIFHPHNPEVVEALIDNVEIIDNSRFINGDSGVLAKLFESGKNLQDTLILMSSDAGGFKPLMKLCDKIGWKGETISASKSRSYNPVSGKSELNQILNVKNLQGKDILIIDDICVYGGTFKGLSKLLKSRNCGKLYLAVSHITVKNLGDDPVTNYFDKVFTTNSKYDNYYVGPNTGYINAPKNLEIIKMF
jgi:ribose-phosphate pyrophosphokinase